VRTRLRVLFLDQYSELGGAQRALAESVRAAVEAGWEAHAALPGDGPLVARLEALGARVHALRKLDYSAGRKKVGDVIRFLRDLGPASREIRALGGELDPAVLYVNGPRLMPAVWRSSLRRPVIFHAHSHVRAVNGGPLVGAAVAGTRATVIAATKFVAREWRCRAHVVYGGVEGPAEQFHRAPGGQLRVGLIGRFSPSKCQKEFVLAAASLAGEWPQAEFVLCGDAIFGDRASLEYKREVLALAPPSVRYLGWQEDIYRVLAEIDLLVMPSRSEGGVPYVVVDAFAAGVPVLASRAGDLGEIIEEGVNGFLLREPTSEAIASGLRELLPEPERLAAAAEAARRLWRERFTAERYRREIREVILECRAQGRMGRAEGHGSAPA
jgi:glycosyltransferase involved in cell wall biosynthesis